MAEAGGSVGVTDVATALGLPMSTSHRLLDLLRGAGFVERDAAQRRYRLGLQFLRVANLVTQNTSFATAVPARPRTDHGGDRRDRHVLRVSAGRSHGGLCRQERQHAFAPLPHHALRSGAGRVRRLRAGHPVVPSVARPRSRLRHATTVAAHRQAPVEQCLGRPDRATRRKGFALSTGAKLPDSIGIAVPISMAEERPVGSLTLTIPQSRFVKSKLKAYVALLSEEARLLSICPVNPCQTCRIDYGKRHAPGAQK